LATVTIIVPTLNEEENIDLLLHRIFKVGRASHLDFDVLFVDSASSDNTCERIRAWQGREPVRLLRREINVGLAGAVIAGAAQTEATYAPIGGRQTIETIAPDGEALSIDYAVPNRNQCKLCHSKDGELTPIGPAARHLNHTGPNAANQIADWTARGILSSAPEQLPLEPAAFGDAAIQDRARAWLDINCAHCHRAGGGASNSGLFLGWDETNPTGWGIHKRPTAAGRGSGDDLFVIEPGKPDQSILVHRLKSVEPGVLMPELGRTVIDREALALIREWIAGMAPAAPGFAPASPR